MSVYLKDRVRFKTESETIEGIVDQVQPLTSRCRVKTDDGAHFLVAVDELEVVESAESVK